MRLLYNNLHNLYNNLQNRLLQKLKLLNILLKERQNRLILWKVTEYLIRMVEKYSKLLSGQAAMLAGLPIADPAEYAQLVCSLMV